MASKKSETKTNGGESATMSEKEMPAGTANTSSNGETELSSAATEAAGQAQETVTRLADQVQQQVVSRLTEQKDKLTNVLETTTFVIQQVGEQVRQQDHATTAEYVDKAADWAEQFTTTVREQEVSELVSQTEQVARQRPSLFLGGALALGVLGTRFFRSSARQKDSPDEAAAGDLSAFTPPSYVPGAAAPVTDASLNYGLPPEEIDYMTGAPKSALDTPLEETMPNVAGYEPISEQR